MAERKSVLGPPPNFPKLDQLLEAAKSKDLSEEVLLEQRISFAYGNAPASAERITKETVRDASKSIRIMPNK